MPQTTRSVITFSKREGGMPMPHLLDIQTAAFQTLLVPDDVHGARQDVSLERVFRDLFPITDVNEKYKLEFLGYSLGEAKYAVEECIERDMTYAAPLKAKLRLDVYEDVEGQRRLKNAIEKEVYPGKLEGRQEKREVIGSLLAVDVANPEDPKGEALGSVGDELTQERLNEMRHKGVKSVTVFAGYSTLDVREEEQPTSTRDRQNHV